MSDSTRGYTDPRLETADEKSGGDTEILSTLFELGREVTSVLDLDELLAKIPQLIARLTSFNAFSVYLLDDRRQELRIAYAVGYPEETVKTLLGRAYAKLGVRGRTQAVAVAQKMGVV